MRNLLLLLAGCASINLSIAQENQDTIFLEWGKPIPCTVVSQDVGIVYYKKNTSTKVRYMLKNEVKKVKLAYGDEVILALSIPQDLTKKEKRAAAKAEKLAKKNAICDSWIGFHKSTLILSWGPPNSTASDGSGGDILIYSHQHFNSAINANWIDHSMFYCDSAGIIYTWKKNRNNVAPTNVIIKNW